MSPIAAVYDTGNFVWLTSMVLSQGNKEPVQLRLLDRRLPSCRWPKPSKSLLGARAHSPSPSLDLPSGVTSLRRKVALVPTCPEQGAHSFRALRAEYSPQVEQKTIHPGTGSPLVESIHSANAHAQPLQEAETP
jgi:hypothetical protein